MVSFILSIAVRSTLGPVLSLSLQFKALVIRLTLLDSVRPTPSYGRALKSLKGLPVTPIFLESFYIFLLYTRFSSQKLLPRNLS
jgi:hypothetical protein